MERVTLLVCRPAWGRPVRTGSPSPMTRYSGGEGRSHPSAGVPDKGWKQKWRPAGLCLGGALSAGGPQRPLLSRLLRGPSPRALTRSGTARGVQDAGCGAPAATVTTHTPLSAFGLLRGVRVSVLSSDASARPWPEASFSCPHPRPSPGRLVPADQLWSHPWCKRSYFQSSHYCPVCAYGVFIPCCLCVPSLGRVIWSSGESIVQPRLQGPGRGGLGDGEPVGPSRPGAPPLLGSSPRAAGGRMAHVGPPWPRCSPTACGRPMGAFGALANTRAGSRRWGSL